MLEPKTKPTLAKEAWRLGQSYNMVRYREVTYIPLDFETRAVEPTDPLRTVWSPVSRSFLQRMAAEKFNTLFTSDSESRSFEFMVAQSSIYVDGDIDTLLVATPDGLKELLADGTLGEPDGTFRPNTLRPVLNDDKLIKQQVLDVITEWVDGEEEAHSLLHHLATCLSPGYSAIRYVLLLGEGRNGKSVLLKMCQALFGNENVSGVTRQMIAEGSPTVCELNGMLLNLVYDGQAEYLKDSGREKSLIAGEPVEIRKLYESTPTKVQTNALFVEGLNKEPKSGDKTSALQKRLVRFQFPNYYPDDRKFEKLMLSKERLGAFLALLLDHYVLEEETALRLAPTAKTVELQLEHMYVNSLALQFFKHVEENSPLGVNEFLGAPAADLVPAFRSWRLKENDLGTWAEPDVLALFGPLINTERRSARVKGVPRKVRVVTSLKLEAKSFIESLERSGHGGANALQLDEAAMVED